MNKHHGQIIEKIIRLNGYNISEIARRLCVDRRTIYVWFKKKRLKQEVILLFAEHVNYNFSIDFPEVFQDKAQADLLKDVTVKKEAGDFVDASEDKNLSQKYMELLEKYNDLLSKMLFK